MAYSFIHRILHAEIPPPASCWDKIAGELDKNEPKNFIDKLSAASVEPPPSVWNRISESLGSTSSRRSVVVNWMKWSAAAVIAGGLIITASFYLTSQKKDITASNSPNKESSNNSSTTEDKTNQSPDTTIAKDSSGAIAQNIIITTNNGTNSPRSTSMLIPVRHATIEAPAQDNDLSQLRGSPPNISDNVSPDAAKYIPAPDYYVVTAPNGERVKISSKFSDAVVSLVGGDNVDYLWKSKFDNWKAKLISNPSFIPAAGNFLDIAELKDLLKEQ